MFSWGTRRGLRGKDGKIGTDDFAVMAIDTRFRLFDHRGAITLDVVAGGEFEHIPGAVFDAITAAFASLVDDVHHSPGNFNFIDIKRSPPIFHGYWFLNTWWLLGLYSLGKPHCREMEQ
jgi:hypothetical protein